MGLHFIKNGTKHDVCVKRPSLFPASDTTYDNSQSGLAATRVQGAIDELVSGTVLATVTADGVKTFSQLFGELYASISADSITKNSVFVDDSNGHLYRITGIGSSYVFTRAFLTATGSVSVGQITIASVGKLENTVITTGGSGAYTDASTSVPTSGKKYAIYM